MSAATAEAVTRRALQGAVDRSLAAGYPVTAALNQAVGEVLRAAYPSRRARARTVADELAEAGRVRARAEREHRDWPEVTAARRRVLLEASGVRGRAAA